MPRLQVALDLTDLDKAIQVASRIASICEHRKLLFEAGTPLIKRFGMDAVKRLANLFPDIPIVADMKTADVGALEAELAVSNGAMYVTVLAQASDETILAAVEAAHRLGGKVMVDLMSSVGDPILQGERLKKLSADAVCYHVPIDVQRLGTVNWRTVIAILKVMKILGISEVAVAGGISPEVSRKLVEGGADILVVGRYIYSASDPARAAQSILEELG